MLFDRYKEEQRMHDRRIGRLCAVIVNMNRGKKGKSYSEEDFMPKEKRRQTNEEMFATVEALNRMFGGENIVRDK